MDAAMSEVQSIVVDTLATILTYSPADQRDSTRVIRWMTAQNNGVDFSRVPRHPAIQTKCNLFTSGWSPAIFRRGETERSFEEIRRQMVQKRGDWKFA